MNKKVIYTSLVGKYDKLDEPDYILKDWDYICFTNDFKSTKDSIWKIKNIPKVSKDKLRLSRFAKLNPHKVLRDYTHSLWIDANIGFNDVSIEERLNELIFNNVLISIPKHPFRDCLYDEATSCIKDGRDSQSIIKKQIDFIKNENFPANYGLFENNIIFRKHMDPEIIKLDEAWWDMYMKYSKRDQLSLVFLLWKHNLVCETLFNKDISARNHPGINYVKHKPGFKNKFITKINRNLNKLSK